MDGRRKGGRDGCDERCGQLSTYGNRNECMYHSVDEWINRR